MLCVVRDHEGRWLAGRRAEWVASWAGVWALGAGGAVDAGEDPAHALGRELQEEWGVEPERLAVEALIATPGDMAMLIGQAWLAPGAEVTRDHEHDAHAWWPPDPAEWPDEAHPQLRRMAALLVNARPVSFRTLKYLSFTHSAIYTALLVVAITGAADDAEVRARLGARHRLDRDVAALHRRRAAARDPALARRDGRRRRRRRPLRGQPSASCMQNGMQDRLSPPATRYGLGP